MSTNVYLHLDACPHCGRSDGEGLHVGKSSAGFHGYLAGNLSLPDWWGPTFGWQPPVIVLDHPQGNTITAVVDYGRAIVYVSDPSDVRPAREWVEYRRAVNARHATRRLPNQVRAFPDWQIVVR